MMLNTEMYKPKLDENTITRLGAYITDKDDCGYSSSLFLYLLIRNILQVPNDWDSSLSIYKPSVTSKTINTYLQYATKNFVIFERFYFTGDTIPMMSNGYKLTCAGLSTGKHVIAGLICDGVQYVYDSNNFIATTNWASGDFINYYKKLRDLNIPLNIEDIFISTRFIIYHKQSTAT
jgi:hypothetical protein